MQIGLTPWEPGALRHSQALTSRNRKVFPVSDALLTEISKKLSDIHTALDRRDRREAIIETKIESILFELSTARAVPKKKRQKKQKREEKREDRAPVVRDKHCVQCG